MTGYQTVFLTTLRLKAILLSNRPVGLLVKPMPNERSSIDSSSRERILDAAIDVVAERGYSAASVQEIVERSDTSKGGFYFHFPSKEKMVTSLVGGMTEKLIKRVYKSIENQPTALHRLAVGFEVLISTFARQRKVARVLLLSLMGHGKETDRSFFAIRDRLSDLIQRELDRAVAEGQIPPQDTSLVSHMWVGALHEVILRWLLSGQPNSLTSVTTALCATLFRSVGADPTLLGMTAFDTDVRMDV